MSDSPSPTASPAAWDGLLDRVASQLAPLFESSDTDHAAARKAALSAMTAYNPECRADFVNIARILAFSLATLSALSIAAADDVPAAMKMRYFGKANALSRSADQSERIMMQRRREQRAHETLREQRAHETLREQRANETPREQRANEPLCGHRAHPRHDPRTDAPTSAQLEPLPDAAEFNAAIESAVEEAMAVYRATRSQRPAGTSVHPAEPAFPPGQPTLLAALRDAVPVQPASSSLKQSLLQHSAIHRVVNTPLPPG